MTFRRVRRTLGRVAGVGLTATVVIGMATAPAYADTSTATANAATVQIGSGTLLTTGTCTASSPGGQSGPCGPVTFPTNVALSAALLAQESGAVGGVSGACAGAVGQSGTISINPDGTCAFTAGTPSGGVTLNLGAVATIKADAIIAECTASSTGAPTAQVQLVNATISLLNLGIPIGAPIVLTSPTSPNVNVASLPSLLTITLNDQKDLSQPTGGVATSAVRITLLGVAGDSLLGVTIGTVTCGPNAITAPSPAFPAKGVPIAAGMVLVAGYLGWRFWLAPRRREASTQL
jgi:hypothetical protein